MGDPIRVWAYQASAGFFSIYQVQPILGRLFTAEEDRPGGTPVAVLNYPLWQNRFGADPGVIGKNLNLDGRSYTIIGVLPKDFDWLPMELVYVPLDPWAANAMAQDRGHHMGINAIASLRPGVSVAQARLEMEGIARRLEREYPKTNSGRGVIVAPMFELQVSRYQTILRVLMGAVGFVLLIACTNVANLLLARASARQKEMAVRSALGAGRLRLIRQMLCESVALALAGGSLGLLLGAGGLNLIRKVLPANVPRLHLIRIDARVLAYALGVSLLTGLLFGLAPALGAVRPDLAGSLKQGGRGSGAAAGGRLRSLLLVSEVALAFVLLAGAGLMIRSIFELRQNNPGFDPANVLSIDVPLTDPKYTGAPRRVFYRQLLSRVQSLPGVKSAALALTLPVMPPAWGTAFIVEGRPVPPRAALPFSILDPVSPGYFQTMRIPVLKGRGFQESDNERATLVIIIGEALARRAFPNQDPIGKRIKLGWPEDPAPWREIVGVAGDVKQSGLDADVELQSYLPLEQETQPYVRLIARTTTSPLGLASAVRAEIHSLDGNLPVFAVTSMEQYLNDWLAPRRFTLLLLSMFAGLALLLAGVGIYGVMAYSVTQRTQEIGVRMALGAQPGHVLGLVLRQAMALTAAGLAIGVVVAVALTRVMSRLLFGISSSDPATFAGVSLVLLVVALAACYLPARRATKVDPIIALRVE